MIKFIFRLVILLVLVCLFGSLAFSIFGKVFGWLSTFFYWVANWLDKIGIVPIIRF